MKINVDGDVVTIDYGAKTQQVQKEPEIDIAPKVEGTVKRRTYLDELKKLVSDELQRQLEFFNGQNSSFIVSWSKEYSYSYTIGTDTNWALNQLAAKYGKLLDWSNPDSIIEWLNSEIEEKND